MKKIIVNLFLITTLLFILLLITLSTVGVETNKFNKFISNKVSQRQNINLDLDKIKFKIDPKELSLFLETRNPKINYRGLIIPVKNIKVYFDFLSFLKTEPKIKKINLNIAEIDIAQLNDLSKIIKPSNFKSFLNNKIKQGKIVSEIEVFLDEKGSFKNFIAKGEVKNLRADLISGLFINKTNFNFFADKEDVLLKNIFGRIEDIEISEGDIKLNLGKGFKLSSNFKTIIDINEEILKKYNKIFNKVSFEGKIDNIKANFNNNFSIEIDETYGLKDYNYNFSGNLDKANYTFKDSFRNNLIYDEIDKIYFSDLKISSVFKPKKISLKGEGKYSFNNEKFLKINFSNIFDENLIKSKLNFDYSENFVLELINYKKSKNSIANISLDIEKRKKNLELKTFIFEENDNLIKINNLKFQQNTFLSFNDIIVKTKNNEFSIKKNKKILIKGNKFDASNLIKFINNQNSENSFKKISNEIEIDFQNIKIPMSENLQNFKLIGIIQKGKFVKISSKGDFGGNNYLDISMKKDNDTNKKYLEIYSDLTRPLLSEYSFFRGLSGGKLLFTSIIDKNKSSSKLKIENFKVINAPGVIKLLSLADLGGLVDLAEGEGLSFDVLEIDMEKEKNFLKINEILALGPSMSVLMEGYQDENGLTSIRGTLVPAKTLNKLISKIPVIGDIIIPKEVGEGLFGISFKMKGPKGQIKTSINPIKTLTPRFIQKILERNKETK